MKYYPVTGEPPKDVDRRIIDILKQYLPTVRACDAPFSKMVRSCPNSCSKNENEHEVILGLGEQKNLHSFGKLFFQCKRAYGKLTELKDVQLKKVQKAALVYDILELDPPAIFGKALCKSNEDSWKTLLQSPYKNERRMAEIEDARRQKNVGMMRVDSDGLTVFSPSRVSPIKARVLTRTSSITPRTSARTTPTSSSQRDIHLDSAAKQPTPSPARSRSSAQQKPQPKPRPAYKGARVARDEVISDCPSSGSSLPSKDAVRRIWHGKSAHDSSVVTGSSQIASSSSCGSKMPKKQQATSSSLRLSQASGSSLRGCRSDSPELIEICSTASEPSSDDLGPVSTPTPVLGKRGRAPKTVGGSAKRLKAMAE